MNLLSFHPRFLVLALLLLLPLACEDRAEPPGQPIDSYTIPAVEATTDRISVYFTEPDNTADTTDPDASPVGKALVDLIESQTSGNIYLCFYDFDYQPVIDAVQNAISNGVVVYFVGDVDESTDAGYTAVTSAIIAAGGSEQETIKTSGSAKCGYSLIYPTYIMHNKFALVTDTETGKRYVWTGSTNVSESGMLYNNNNAIIVQSQDMYDIYLQQFRYLYDGSADPVSERKNIAVGNVHLSILFSYTDSGRSHENLPVSVVSAMIEEAVSAVCFMMFSFTHTDTASALISRSENGVTVRGILDESQNNTNSDIVDMFSSAELDFRIDGNDQNDPHNPLGGAKLHHKCVIIDPDDATNAAVVTGSTNLTNAGNDLNAENMVILYSSDYAELFVNEFDARWEEASSRFAGGVQ